MGDIVKSATNMVGGLPIVGGMAQSAMGMGNQMLGGLPGGQQALSITGQGGQRGGQQGGLFGGKGGGGGGMPGGLMGGKNGGGRGGQMGSQIGNMFGGPLGGMIGRNIGGGLQNWGQQASAFGNNNPQGGGNYNYRTKPVDNYQAPNVQTAQLDPDFLKNSGGP